MKGDALDQAGQRFRRRRWAGCRSGGEGRCVQKLVSLPMKVRHCKNPFGEWTIIAIGPTAERQHVLDRRIRPAWRKYIVCHTAIAFAKSEAPVNLRKLKNTLLVLFKRTPIASHCRTDASKALAVRCGRAYENPPVCRVANVRLALPFKAWPSRFCSSFNSRHRYLL